MSRVVKVPAMVVLNPAARGGKGRQLWERVRAAPDVAHLDCRTTEIDEEGRWHESVDAALADGIRMFIAAGGDGTVHALVNALVEVVGVDGLGQLYLGAVGLGSSNDFHKPKGHRVRGIPVKIAPETGRQRDVCLARFVEPRGRERSEYFIVSASLGITAECNNFFNTHRGRLFRWMKRHWTGGAIFYAAAWGMATLRNTRARLRLETQHRETAITNLNVLKTPYVSGGFSVDTPVARDDGLLSVNLCEGMGRLSALRTLCDMARGRFADRPRRFHWQVSSLEVEPATPMALELDGELFSASRVRFEVLPVQIMECS